MTNLLYFLVEIITKVHNFILKINDSYEYTFTDKELHFLVIGFLGIALILLIYPLFKSLAKKRTHFNINRNLCIYFNSSYNFCN